MRELERDLPSNPQAAPEAPAAPRRLAIVGDGRTGGAIARAAHAAGIGVEVHGRDSRPDIADPEGTAVLLCVPDGAIARLGSDLDPTLPSDVAIGHTSGATTLDALPAGRSRFSLHPLQTIPTPHTELTGAPCAIACDSPAALGLARGLAETLGMRPFEVAEGNRAAYHAAASVASNFLVALEESATGLLEAAGVADAREILAPLVLRTAANWADAGAGALTGPIARGDEATVERHREALRELAPALEPLYDALAERTRALAGGRTEP